MASTEIESEGEAMRSGKVEIPNVGGRPEIWSQELADSLCQYLAMGESLRTACSREEMPSIATVFKWMREKEGFSEQYARAKQEAADYMAEEILDIADDGENDYMMRERPDGTEFEVTNHENIQRSKLRVDTRRWLMSKMKPKKYGEKLDLTSGGEKLPTPIMPVQHVLPDNSDTEDSVTEEED